jgi:hypothetical protein
MERRYKAPMLTSTFTIQAYVPKKSNSTNIDKLMKTLIEHSNWISMNKTESAQKSISKLLSLALIETLIDSTANQVSKKFLRPQPASTFLIQTEVLVEAYKKEVAKNEDSDKCYGYSDCTTGVIWDEFIRNPFEKTRIEIYLTKISPKLMANKTKKTQVRPPFRIDFASLTVDVGESPQKDKKGEILMQNIKIYTYLHQNWCTSCVRHSLRQLCTNNLVNNTK